jgi:uncharacterized protein (DUF697 family)
MRIPGIPVDVNEMMSTGTKVRDERERPVRLTVFIDVAAPDELVVAVEEALRPETANARIVADVVKPGEVSAADSHSDAIIGIAGLGDTLAATLATSREGFAPTVAVAVADDRERVASILQHPIVDTVVGDDADEAVGALGHWLADRLEGKDLALAANFGFMRRAIAEDAVKKTAFQNALIGTVTVIPGADMPLMTANQGKMILQIAAAYGEPLGAERIKELAVVVGGAFILRAIARQGLTFLPGFGWAIKGAIGYTGTLAMGKAAVEYFDAGGDVAGLAERLEEARDKAVVAVRRRRGGLVDEGPIPASGFVVDEEGAAGAHVADVGLPAASAAAPGAEAADYR